MDFGIVVAMIFFFWALKCLDFDAIMKFGGEKQVILSEKMLRCLIRKSLTIIVV